ncbi:MAG: MBL fold metallo-hydrolase [Planctomycetota bacterium]|nr:MAG: MBL fold metallo-hydrolase [Planctomycetota bacterium]
MHIGPYQLTAIDAGRFRLDGGSMFGSIPKTIWERVFPADEKNRITLALRTLLVRGEGRTILCEIGIGDKWTDRERDIYGIDGSNEKLLSALSDHNVSPDDVTDIIISHLHFDHAGGLTDKRPGNTLVPTFPEARVHIQRKNREWALAQNEREQASYLLDNITPIEEAGLLELHDGPGELFPGIDIMVADGHTRGMQMARISDGSTTLVFVADLIPTRAHIRLPFIMGFDIEAIRTLEEKKQFLTSAAAEGWILFFTHDPDIAACRAESKDGDFVLSEPVEL